jgi:hypothetical protein
VHIICSNLAHHDDIKTENIEDSLEPAEVDIAV